MRHIIIMMLKCNEHVIYPQSTSEASIRRATMMGDMHLRNLRQKSLLKQRTEDALKKLQVSRKMSLVRRKPDFGLCKNKGADQLRSNCEAGQHLCFLYLDSTISLLSKS